MMGIPEENEWCPVKCNMFLILPLYDEIQNLKILTITKDVHASGENVGLT